MQRNKSIDVVNIEKSKIELDSLIDYIDLDMFEEYRVIVRVNKSLLKKEYITYDFDSYDKFKNFVATNSDVIVCSMWSDFKDDTCMLSVVVK